MGSLQGLSNGTNGSANGTFHASGPTKVGLTSPLVDEHPTPLKIVIVGAGIGGLSAALSLRRNGHQVEVNSLAPNFSARRNLNMPKLTTLRSSTSSHASPTRPAPPSTSHPIVTAC